MVATCTLDTSHFSGNVFLCFLFTHMVSFRLSIDHWREWVASLSLPRCDPGIYSHLLKQPETYVVIFCYISSEITSCFTTRKQKSQWFILEGYFWCHLSIWNDFTAACYSVTQHSRSSQPHNQRLCSLSGTQGVKQWWLMPGCVNRAAERIINGRGKSCPCCCGLYSIIVTTFLYLISHCECIKDLFVSFCVNWVKTKANTKLGTWKGMEWGTECCILFKWKEKGPGDYQYLYRQTTSFAFKFYFSFFKYRQVSFFC